MKKELSWLLILLVTCLASCQTPGPKIGICIIGEAGLLCHNENLPENVQDYIVKHEDSMNYIAVSYADYQILDTWLQRNCK